MENEIHIVRSAIWHAERGDDITRCPWPDGSDEGIIWRRAYIMACGTKR